MFRNCFPIPNGNHILSAPISLKNDIPYTIMPVSFAIISMCIYPCDTAFAACNITRVSNSSWLHGLSGYSDTSAPGTGLPNTFASRVDITSSFLHRIWSEQLLLADNVTIPPCSLCSTDRFQFLGNFPFPSCRIRCLIPAPLLSLLWWLLINRLADCGPIRHQLFKCWPTMSRYMVSPSYRCSHGIT